jgi:flagellar biosynthesis/type III secretory pathway M-ring protein FliF/YscJ
MAEFLTVFLLYTFKADWYWWIAFILLIGLEIWAEYRKIIRTWKLHKTAKYPE